MALTYSELQHPRIKGERKFQDICLKLLQHEWDDPHAQLHARSGQRQHGSDITGNDNRNRLQNAGCQCKGSETNDWRSLSEKELEDEVELAKGFEPALDIFIVAYMGQRDGPLQRKAIELNNANKDAGLFKVVLWSWDDIIERAASYPEVRKELMVEEGYVLPSTLDPKRPQADLAAQIAALEVITDRLRSNVPPETSTVAPVDAIAEAKIDVWRDQIRNGSGKSVIEPLRAFIDSLDASANAHVRFRAHANLGSALEQDGQNERAAVEFEQASKAELDTADSHAYAARGLLLRGLTSEALSEADKALGLDKECLLAGLIVIHASPEAVTGKELEARLAAQITNLDITGGIAQRYSEAGQHEDALRVARLGEIKDSAIRQHIHIAQAIMHMFENNLSARMGIPISSREQELLEEAKTLLEKGWAWAKVRPDANNWVHLAGNLTGVYRLLGKEEEADALALEAHALNPKSNQIAERAVVALVHRREHTKALEIAVGVAEAGGERGALLATDIATLTQDWPTAEHWARKAYAALPADQDKAHAAERIVMAVYRQKDAVAALQEANELRKTFRSNVGFEGHAAEIARRAGDKAESEAARARLDGFDRSLLNPLERFELANAYADSDAWLIAADLLNGLYSLDRPSLPLTQRLFYLFRADRRAEGRELYESLSGEALRSPEVLRLGAAIYERSGLLPQALAALNTALAINPSDLRSRLDWARLCFRGNNEASVSKWIRKAPLDFDAKPEELLEYAQLLDRYGRRKDAVALGYKTVRANWGASEKIHMMYMSLFFLQPKVDAFIRSKAVNVDTVVFLESERGEKRDYRLEKDAAPSPDVLSPEHPFAKLLMGHKVGDQVSLAGGIGKDENWRIVEIKHKFLDLLHRMLESHETDFPGSRSLARFHIEPEKESGFEPIFEQARARAQLVEDISRIYKDNPIPIDAVAKTLGTDPIEASIGLRYSSKITLESCTGTEQERVQAQSQLAAVRRLMIEPVTLAIWQEIDFLEIAQAIPDLEIVVVQATIDALAIRADAAATAIDQEGGSLEAHGDKFALVQSTKEGRSAYADSCAKLLGWARENASIIPSESLEALDGDLAEKVISDASATSLGTTAKADIILIAEDRRLRMLGTAVGVNRSGWTQALLMTLRADGRISQRQYVTLIAKLHQCRVGFVTVGREELLSALELGAASPEFESVVDALFIPTVEHGSLIHVTANFLAACWTRPEHREQRQSVSSRCLERFLLREEGISLMRRVIIEVHNLIAANPFAIAINAKWWEQHVVAFIQGHFIRDLISKD